jgi:aminopeptidase N
MERVSGKPLESFFNQWLEKGGHPVLSGSWSYDPKKKAIKMELIQNQATLFNTPIEVGISDISGKMVKHTVQLSQKRAEFSFSASKRPKEVVLDPDTWLLFDGEILPK